MAYKPLIRTKTHRFFFFFFDTIPLKEEGYSYEAIREELKDRMASPREVNKNFWTVVDAAFKCMENTSDENYIENSFPQIEGDLRNATKVARKDHCGSARFEKPDPEKTCVKMTVQTLVHLPASDRMLLCVVCDDHKKTSKELKFLEDERNYDAVLFSKGAHSEKIQSLNEKWNEAEHNNFNEGFFDKKENTTKFDFLDQCDFKNRNMVLKATSTLPVDLVEAYLSRGGICIVNVAQDAAEYNALIVDFDDIRRKFLERFEADENTLIVSSKDVAKTEIRASVRDCIDKHMEKYEEAYTDVAVEFRYGFNVME